MKTLQKYRIALETEKGLSVYKFHNDKTLMKFAYFGIAETEKIFSLIENNPTKVYIVGNKWIDYKRYSLYAYNEKCYSVCDLTWKLKDELVKPITNTTRYSTTAFGNGYLVNHSRKETLSLSRYIYLYKNATSFDVPVKNIINPLPILCAIGNGMENGGDYKGTDAEYCGRWKGNQIEYKETLSNPECEYWQTMFQFVPSY